MSQVSLMKLLQDFNLGVVAPSSNGAVVDGSVVALVPSEL